MKISFLNNINFCSQRLFSAQLYKQTIDNERIPLGAYVSLLDKSDLDRFELHDDNWKDDYGYRTIGNDILWDLRRKKANSFWNNIYFLGIECPSEDEYDRIKALAEVIKTDKNIKLDLLQSRSVLENPSERTVGAGSLIIYMLTKLAQKEGKNRIRLVSIDDSSSKFYKKVGFNQDYKSVYVMDEPKISEIGQELEKKYNIIPINDKNNPFV